MIHDHDSTTGHLAHRFLEAGWALYTHVFRALLRHVHLLLAMGCLAAITFSMWHHQPRWIAAIAVVGFVSNVTAWYHRSQST